MNRVAQEALEAQAETMIEIAYMTPKRCQSELMRLSKVFLEESNQIAQIYLQDTPSQNSRWTKVRFFAEMVSQERRQAVLRGEVVSIPFERLSKEGQEVVRANQDKEGTENPDGTITWKDSPPPLRIRFTAKRTYSKNNNNCVKLMMYLDSNDGFGGQSLFGMMDRGLMRRSYANWILPGDTKSSPLANQIVKRPVGSASKTATSQLDIINKLIDVASVAPISYLWSSTV